MVDVDGGRGIFKRFFFQWDYITLHHVESSVNRSTFYLQWPELIKKFPTILQ